MNDESKGIVAIIFSVVGFFSGAVLGVLGRAFIEGVLQAFGIVQVFTQLGFLLTGSIGAFIGLFLGSLLVMVE